MAEAAKKGWTRVAFGDVVRLSRERSRDPEGDGFKRYVGLEHLDPGDLKIRRWGNVANGTTFTMVFRPGQVLFGKRRAYQRKVAVADFSGVCSGDTYVFEPKNEHLLPELLPFICQTDAFFDHAIGTSDGSLSPRTNWKSLAQYELQLPSLSEQRRFVRALEASRTAIESLHEARTAGVNLQLSHARSAYVTSRAERIELGDVASFRTGKRISISSLPKEPDAQHRVPVMGGNGLAGFTTHPLNGIPIPLIVIGRVGEYCGAVHLVKEPAWVSDNALYVSELDRSLHPEFIALCLEGALLNTLSVGGAQPLVNQTILGRLRIPALHPRDQDDVIDRGRQIAVALDALDARAKESSELLRYLLGVLEGHCR